MDRRLLDILVCPADRGPLLLIDEAGSAAGPSGPVLYNPRLRRAYRIEDGIPVLLVDEATDVDAQQHDLLMARAGG